MDKIVIMTDVPKGNSPLVKNLRVLFPECEIQVKSKKDANGAVVSAPQFLENGHDGHENDDNACE